MRLITKKHLARRSFLRGVGVSVALPLLDSMLPAQTPLAKTAARLMVGETLPSLGLTADLEVTGVFVKTPVFPFVRFPGVDTILGPEMKSTGEVMGGSTNFGVAFAKAQLSVGQRLPAREDFYISVNLSAAVLRSPGLREYVAEVLDTTRTSPSNLKFELSEGGLTSNVATARAVLDAFHEMGIELMLDDFGTGYSSLSYLQLFPFDYVKVDRPFVSRTGS